MLEIRTQLKQWNKDKKDEETFTEELMYNQKENTSWVETRQEGKW